MVTTARQAILLLDDARQWRARAEEMRSAAEDMRDASCRLTALKIAEDYDRMAKHAELRVCGQHIDGSKLDGSESSRRED
jgi:hypothetical protein